MSLNICIFLELDSLRIHFWDKHNWNSSYEFLLQPFIQKWYFALFSWDCKFENWGHWRKTIWIHWEAVLTFHSFHHQIKRNNKWCEFVSWTLKHFSQITIILWDLLQTNNSFNHRISQKLHWQSWFHPRSASEWFYKALLGMFIKSILVPYSTFLDWKWGALLSKYGILAAICLSYQNYNAKFFSDWIFQYFYIQNLDHS